jgi:hypothetical protein
MSARPKLTTPATSRLAVAAVAVALSVIGPSVAQQAERPCRIVFDDSMKGAVDPTSTHGEINLGPVMPQPGGGFVVMGQGRATVTYGAENQVLSGGCKVVRNRVFEYPVQAFVTSDDGANGDIDIVPGVFSYTVEFSCTGPQGGKAELDVAISVPPTVTLPMIRGASQRYSDGDRRARLEGTMSLEFCRVEPR